MGFVSAIVITMVITCPMMGTLDVATDCLSIATKAYSKVNRYIGERNYEAVFEYSDDILGNAFYQFGGKLIYRSVASTYLYGEKVYLMPEIENADATAAVAIPFYYQIVSQRYDAKTQVAYINGMCEGLEQTEVCDGILADCTRKFSEKWSAGRRFYGISRPETNDLIDPFLDEVFHACIYTTKDDVKQNLTTVLQIMAVVIESDVLYVDTDHYEQVMEVLEDSNLIAELDKLLESNPSMQNIKTSSILMRVLASHIDSLEYEQEMYDSMMTDLADAINAVNNKGYGSHEEKAQALALHVVNVLKNYGVTISQGIAEQVAPELLALHADQEADVSAAQVREMIERYAQ